MPQTGRYVKTSEGLQVFASDVRAGARVILNTYTLSALPLFNLAILATEFFTQYWAYSRQ